MRYTISLFTALVLIGCTPPKALKMDNITASGSLIDPKGIIAPMNAPEYVQAGYNKVYSLCTTYFDDLISEKNSVGFAGDISSAGGAAAAAIMGIASVSSGAIGGMGAGVGFLTATINSFDKHELVTPYPDETKSLILKALNEFASSNSPSTTTDAGQAVDRVQQYAEMCTYSGISRFAKEALTKADVTTIGNNVNILTPQDTVYVGQIQTALNGTLLNFDQLAWLRVYVGAPDTITEPNKDDIKILTDEFSTSVKLFTTDNKDPASDGSNLLDYKNDKIILIRNALDKMYNNNIKFKSRVDNLNAQFHTNKVIPTTNPSNTPKSVSVM